MKKAMQEKGLDKILINYFVYQKIKTDEQVVKSEPGCRGGVGSSDHGRPSGHYGCRYPFGRGPRRVFRFKT